jgi:hypothetical protein
MTRRHLLYGLTRGPRRDSGVCIGASCGHHCVRLYPRCNVLRPEMHPPASIPGVSALLATLCDSVPYWVYLRASRLPKSEHNQYSEVTVNLSPEERERRRRVAIELHRQGRLGTKSQQREGGKAKARKASQLAQQLVEKHQGEIEKALVDGLKNGTRAQKIRAAEGLLKLSLSSERLDVAEHRDVLQHQSREELLDVLVAKLNAPTPAARLIRARMAQQNGGTIEGQAVELPRA